MRYASRSLLTLCLGTVLVSGAPQARAERPTFTQSFNDVEEAPCEGFAADGASYSYSIDGAPSLGCNVGMTGPTTNNVEPPLIQFGAGGVLRLQFNVPTTSFGFGIAQLATDAEFDTVIVDLFRPGVGLLREKLVLDNFPDPEFIGARFEYEGSAIRSATIRVAETSGRPVAVDNITYARPRGRWK